jgi:EAL and modified HD-GYP domain-containing signal transduction protein
MPSKVDSIKKALVVLGLKPLKSWVTVIGLSMVDDKPPELINISLTRAKMCEQLASGVGCDENAAFTVGLFSMLDVLLDKPLAELVQQLPLDAEVTAALLGQKGKLGALLKLVTFYENGQWKAVDKFKLDMNAMRQTYLDSLNWSNALTSRITD